MIKPLQLQGKDHGVLGVSFIWNVFGEERAISLSTGLSFLHGRESQEASVFAELGVCFANFSHELKTYL